MNLKNLVIANAAMTMTLKEITDLLKVRHDKAMLKVAEMAKEQEFGWMSKTDIQYSSGKGRIETIETYQLDKRQSIAVASRLNTALLMRIIDRWQELENQSKPSLPTTYIAALEALVASEKAKELALLQVDELQVELDESKAYCTIKRFAFFNKVDWKDLSWKRLKAAHIRITGEDVHKIFDANFPEGVNAYHKEAFAEVYPTLEYPDIV
jgi:phage regulator Rha-like protein